MPVSFSITFGGSSIHISSFSGFSPASRSRPSTSTSPYPYTYPSTTSTRFTTLASQSNALRNAAFARSNRGSNGSHRAAGMFLLHLSMLSLVPLLFDSAHGQSAYGYTKRGMASMAADNHAMQEQEEQLREDYALSNKPIQRSGSVKLQENDPAANPGQSHQESIVRLQKDLLAKVMPMLAKPAIREQNLAMGQEMETAYRGTLEEASQAIAIVHGIVSLDLQLGRDPLHTLQRRALHDFVRHIITILQEHHASTYEESSYVENTIQAVKRDFAQLLGTTADYYNLEPGHSLSQRTCKAIYSFGVKIQDTRLATMGWLLRQNARMQGCETDDGGIHHTILWRRQEQAEAVCSNILSGLRDLPGNNPARVEETYVDAVSAYTSVLACLKAGKLRSSTKLASVLQMMLHLPVPPPLPASSDALDSQPAQHSELPTSHFSTAPYTLEEAIAQHHLLFRGSHAFLISLVEGLINSRQSTDSERFKIHYNTRATRWEVQSVLGDTHVVGQEESQNVEQQALVEQIAQDPELLQILLEYCYRHLKCWEAGEAVYSRASRRAITSHLERVKSMPDMQMKRRSREDTQRTRQNIGAMRLRAVALLRRPEGEVRKVTSQVLAELAEQSGFKPYTSARERENDDEVGEQAQEDEVQWQVELLLGDKSIQNDIVVATLSLWTATSQFQHLRLFVHHFLTLRGQLINERKQLSLSASHRQGLSPYVAEEITTRLVPHQAKFDRWSSSPAIWVALLNAACKHGNISLTEKIWLAACEEEEKRDWQLPIAAYTSMLHLYGAEARREVGILRSRRRNRCDSDQFDSDSGTSETPELSTITSRTTGYYRIQLRRQGVTRHSAKMAWNVYRRMGETQADVIPDVRFFNAAFHVFRQTSSISAKRRRSRYPGRALRKLRAGIRVGRHPRLATPSEAPTLSLLMRDIINTGYPVPIMLRTSVRPAQTGTFSYRPRLSAEYGQLADSPSSQLHKWTSSFGLHDTHKLYTIKSRRDHGYRGRPPAVGALSKRSIRRKTQEARDRPEEGHLSQEELDNAQPQQS